MTLVILRMPRKSRQLLLRACYAAHRIHTESSRDTPLPAKVAPLPAEIVIEDASQLETSHFRQQEFSNFIDSKTIETIKTIKFY